MKPAIPQPIIITIGLTLYFRVPTKATRKMMQLTINEYISSLGELKFSVFINTRAADASSPTTADRKSTRLNSSHYQQSRMPSSA